MLCTIVELFFIAFILSCYTLFWIGDEAQSEYYVILVALTLVYTILLLGFLNSKNIVASTLHATLEIFICFNFLLDSPMKLAIWNSYAYLSIKNWNQAMGKVDMELEDFLQIVGAMTIFVIGIIYHSQTSEVSEETQPLITRWGSGSIGSDSVFERE